MKNAPASLQFAPAQRQGDQRAFFEFFARNPLGQDAHAKAKLYQFLGRLHAANLDDGVEDHAFAAEIILDQPESDAVFAIKDVVLPWNFRSLNSAGLCPGVQRRDNEVQLIGKKRMEFELRLIFHLKVEGQINPLPQQ